ncbi:MULTISPECIES: hypothetical protein [unclassified Bosea (in: a-proteobacteria)]|nr:MULTISPECIES: hypothetical protein [unclassified Bosea (in: a-proteobacteria)]CAD5274233.1 hypothetical protein BOSE21B_30141 [Bosea sp. 21B]
MVDALEFRGLAALEELMTMPGTPAIHPYSRGGPASPLCGAPG